MKKFIFGCTLMLVGAICGTGWIVAYCCACVEPSAWSTVMNVFSNTDGIVSLAFYLIAIIGTVIAIKELKSN